MRSVASLAASFAIVLACAPPAHAQRFPDPPSLALDRFQPPSSSNRILMVPTAQTHALLDFSAGLTLDWAKQPLQIPQGEALVGNQLTAQLMGAIGLGRVELGLVLPFVPYQTTDYNGVLSSFSAAALGDLRFDAKVRFTPKGSLVGGAFQAIAGFPTGQGKNFTSEGGFSFAGRLIGDLKISIVTLAAYVGYRYRTDPAIFYNLYVADEILAGVGAEVTLLHEILDLFAESYGSFGVRTTEKDGRTLGRESIELPLEAIFGVRANLPRGFSASVAAGTGFLHGYGEPIVRIIGAVSYTRSAKDTDNDGVENANDQCPTIPEDKDGFEDGDGCPEVDNDKDDVPDGKDKCADEAEDRDGFEDDDGCPDPDNDKDGFEDAKDKCPNEAEDKDGVQDEDGCPDPDNDNDGIPDADDKCPAEPEDKDGYHDEDGCPEPDNDSDGIVDSDDKCPNQTEDFDNFADDDGCPEPDNDLDGFPDYKDRCPNKAETFNGFADDDGCPEAGHGPDAIKVGKDALDVKGRVFFDTGSDHIQDRSHKLLDTIALVINLHKEIPKVLVAGHTDSRGNPDKNRELSQKRAEAVVKYLIEKGGVFPERLEAKGYGFDEPLLPSAKTAAEHEVNRRVEFRIER